MTILANSLRALEMTQKKKKLLFWLIYQSIRMANCRWEGKYYGTFGGSVKPYSPIIECKHQNLVSSVLLLLLEGDRDPDEELKAACSSVTDNKLVYHNEVSEINDDFCIELTIRRVNQACCVDATLLKMCLSGSSFINEKTNPKKPNNQDRTKRINYV